MTRRISLALALAAMAIHAPQAQTTSWRPTVVAQHGMVAAGHPLAAEAGMRILKAGGNAVDAAIATWAVQGEVEPGMTGLGADMFMLIYLAKTGEVKFINGTGFAPQAATIDFYKSKGGLPTTVRCRSPSPARSAAPRYALKKYGTKPLGDVLAPAIEIAEQGFPITEALARGARQRQGQARQVPVDDEDLVQGRQAAADGRHLVEPGSRADAAGDRRAGAGRRSTSGDIAKTHRRVPEGQRRHHHRSRSGGLSGVRRRADHASTTAASTSTSARRTRRAS